MPPSCGAHLSTGELPCQWCNFRGEGQLYDAIGHTLAAARKEAPAGCKKLCVILTDGLENSSKDFTRQQIYAIIKECEQKGWRFVYLGADHDVWAAGEDLGVAQECRVAFSKSYIGKTFNELSSMNAKYRRGTEHSERAFRPTEKLAFETPPQE